MLKAIDSHHVFDRTEGKKPFLLADGHGSRFGLPFVRYIIESINPWTVCVGVPYTTHVCWQVHDSNKLNGAFKARMKDAKSEYVESRGEYKFVTTDVVPLIKMSFDTTLGNKENAKKAIMERGWGPLNYACLGHPELKATNVTSTNEATTNHITPQRLELDYDNDPYNRMLHGKYTDVLCNEAAKSEGRKKRWAERKQHAIDSEEGLKSIKNLD